MNVKVENLSGNALDYAVAMCQGGTNVFYDGVATHWVTIEGKDRAIKKGWAQSFTPSSEWVHAGSIIERERIDVFSTSNGNNWRAQSDSRVYNAYGKTFLIAAMRCYVASKRGSEVDIPPGLL